MEKKILVVDDDQIVCEFLERFLTKRGFSASVANSGEEALEKIKNDAPAIVLLDIKMPGMDGLTTLKKIRAINKRLGVIIITGVGEEEIAKEAMNSGAYDYITKPLDLDYLDTCLITKILLLST
ncbi:MAG: response regulator [Candidatus Omnitrophota bacterium]|nr:response regulator [Candidatus Omnitrophota bacterium]